MNLTQRRVSIVAVFGSSSGRNSGALELAQSAGREIARQNRNLLTGGTKCGGNGVKEKAICGAEKARDDGFVGAWLGVARDKHTQDSDPATRSEILRYSPWS